MQQGECGVALMNVELSGDGGKNLYVFVGRYMKNKGEMPIFAARFRQTVAGRESRHEESRDSTEHRTS